jgi:hypothetical protein
MHHHSLARVGVSHSCGWPVSRVDRGVRPWPGSLPQVPPQGWQSPGVQGYQADTQDHEAAAAARLPGYQTPEMCVILVFIAELFI